MPIERTVIARDDVATTKRRLAAGVAENRITFGVASLLIVWDIVMIVADPTALAVMRSAGQTL